MNIEIKIDENCTETKLMIYTNKVNDEISNIVDTLSALDNKTLKAYKDEKLYILKQSDIETIYSENGKVYLRYNNDVFTLKNRLYELETILNPKEFLRISNSEIINFTKVENIDFKVFGTLIINFKSKNKAYASRRYIPKIKEFLEI